MLVSNETHFPGPTRAIEIHGVSPKRIPDVAWKYASSILQWIFANPMAATCLQHAKRHILSSTLGTQQRFRFNGRLGGT
jgi:hypothetical protein